MSRFLSITACGLCLSALCALSGGGAWAAVGESDVAVAEATGTPGSLVRPLDQEMVVCQGLDGDVVFEILVDKSKSKPHALAMRVSDPTVSVQLQEIAFFDVQDQQLESKVEDGVVRVIGRVDLKNPLTGRKGERVGGTVLGALGSITVDLDIDFQQTSTPRKRHAGLVTYLKKNGEDFVQDLDCRRQK